MAGVQWGATVAGGEVVGGLARVVEALLFVVGWWKAGDGLTGAIGCNLEVVVTMRTDISMLRTEITEREGEGRIPFKVFPRARAVLGNAMNLFDGQSIKAILLRPFAVILSYMPK